MDVGTLALRNGRGRGFGGGRKQQAVLGPLGAQALPLPGCGRAACPGRCCGISGRERAGGSELLVPVGLCVPALWFLVRKLDAWGGGAGKRLAGLEEEVGIQLAELEFWEQPDGGVVVRKELLK